MAKVDGIVTIQGTVKGMTFYHSKDGQFVRAKGGISKKRILHDPAFQRTRENGMEFGHNAKMGQLVRKSVSGLLAVAKDYRLSSRLAQRMSMIKNLDFVSARGSRKVFIGLESEEGKQVLRGFNFNSQAPFDLVFRGDFDLDPLTGVVSLTDFDPSVHLALPEGATHVSLSMALSLIDLESGKHSSSFSPKLHLSVSAPISSADLIPSALPTGPGFQFYYLLIEFFQLLNGVSYPLKNNAHNVLCLIEVV